MPTEPKWLDPREERAWRTFVHMHDQLDDRLRRHLLQDSGLSEADFKILAVLSEHRTGRMSSRELCGVLQWEKSRLSHQVRRMEEQGLVAREPNPYDARSAMICLLPAGRRAIEEAAPQHVHNVRRHFIDLFHAPPNSTPSPISANESCVTSPRNRSLSDPPPDEPALPH